MTAALDCGAGRDNGGFSGEASPSTSPRAVAAAPIGSRRGPACPDAPIAHRGVEVGAGWNSASPAARPWVSFDIAHPELGPRAFKVNLGRAPDQDGGGAWAMIGCES